MSNINPYPMHKTPSEIKTIEEIWDKYSQHVDSDIDSLQTIAGTSVITKTNFMKAAELYAAQFKREWIKCSERLPEVDERVLLWVESIGVGYSCIGRLKSDNLYYKDKGTLSKPMEIITHWQPLPSTPTH